MVAIDGEQKYKKDNSLKTDDNSYDRLQSLAIKIYANSHENLLKEGLHI